MLPDLNKISTFKSAPTQDKIKKYNQVLDYASTHPNATIRYHASDVILMPYTDADYLVLPVSRSYTPIHYYFRNHILDYFKGTPTPNKSMLTECQTLKTVVYFSAEAETGGTFKNGQNVIPIWHIIETAYLHQQPTKGYPTITNNLTS